MPSSWRADESARPRPRVLHRPEPLSNPTRLAQTVPQKLVRKQSRLIVFWIRARTAALLRQDCVVVTAVRRQKPPSSQLYLQSSGYCLGARSRRKPQQPRLNPLHDDAFGCLLCFTSCGVLHHKGLGWLEIDWHSANNSLARHPRTGVVSSHCGRLAARTAQRCADVRALLNM